MSDDFYIPKDGCSIDYSSDILDDSDIPWFVLFADIEINDIESLEKRVHDWKILNAS